MKTGIALKMSSFGKDRKTRKRETIRRIFRAYQNNHRLVVIDFEWPEFNLIPLEIQRLLEALEQEVKREYRVYVTLASRSNDYDTRTQLGRRHIRALMHLLEQYNDHFGVCLVVGNRAYLTPYERKKSLTNSLNAMTKFVVQRTDQPILIGTEGVQDTVAKLGESYNIIPFFLLTNDLSQKIQDYRSAAGDTPHIAVYAPYVFNKSKQWVTKTLWGYATRRLSVQKQFRQLNIDLSLVQKGPETASKTPLGRTITQIIGDAVDSLALFNEKRHFNAFKRLAADAGVTHLIGLPLIDSWEQYAKMAEVFNPFKAD
ncbi:MAG: DUF7388 family protein [Candidatus Ranarchaeia archaeon]